MPMSDLQAFREETKDWLETNCPPEMHKPGDVCWGGRNATFSHPDQKIWLERMGNKGWTCPTWPKEYGGIEASPIERIIWGQEEAQFTVPGGIFALGLGMCGHVLIQFPSETITMR